MRNHCCSSLVPRLFVGSLGMRLLQHLKDAFPVGSQVEQDSADSCYQSDRLLLKWLFSRTHSLCLCLYQQCIPDPLLFSPTPEPGNETIVTLAHRTPTPEKLCLANFTLACKVEIVLNPHNKNTFQHLLPLQKASLWLAHSGLKAALIWHGPSSECPPI